MKKRIKRKRYNRFKRLFLRYHEWEYARMMSNRLLSNGFIPKRRNLHRAVEYAWRHGTIYGSCWMKPVMKKRIKKKRMPRFNLRVLGYSFFELEQVLEHDIDHKIKRSLSNRRYRESRKEPNNTEMVEFTTRTLKLFVYPRIICQQFMITFHPMMDYYENKSMEETSDE